jgi:hypothetical protein
LQFTVLPKPRRFQVVLSKYLFMHFNYFWMFRAFLQLLIIMKAINIYLLNFEAQMLCFIKRVKRSLRFFLESDISKMDQ